MKLSDFLALARERILLIVLVVVVAVAAVTTLTVLQPPTYEATARVRIASLIGGEETDPGTEAELVRSAAVAARAGKVVAADPDALLDAVSAVGVADSSVLRIAARADDRPRAVAIVNAVAEAYLEVRHEQVSAAVVAESARQTRALQAAQRRLEEVEGTLATARPGSTTAAAAAAERDQLIAQLAVVRTRLVSLADPAATEIGVGEVIQPASSASAVRSQSLPRAAVFGLLLGLPLAFAAVLVLDSLRNTVRTGDEAVRLTGAPLLGVALHDAAWVDPVSARVATIDDPMSPVAESYRTLSHNLSRAAASSGATTILFTGPGGAGTSSLVANVGIALADVGRPASIVEADLRHPRLHQLLGADVAPGLIEVLDGRVELAEAGRRLDIGVDLMPVGHVDGRPDVLLRRGDLAGLLDRVSNPARQRPLSASRGPRSTNRRLVLLDSASILEAAEVSSIAAQVDGVVAVARVGTTTKQELIALADQVRRAGGSLLGVVLIGAKSFTEGTLIADVAPPRVQLEVPRSGLG